MSRLAFHILAACLLLAARGASDARATETENLDLVIAPQTIVVDGDASDWDLRTGVFVCADVEKQQNRLAVWFHAAFDDKNLYLLARWRDPSPLDNSGSAKGSNGFNGDSLQFRIISAPGTKHERVSHWTCWRDADEISLLQATYGRDFKGGNIEATRAGGKQAFRIADDRSGYIQEIAIPWSLLIGADQSAPAAGDTLRFTLQPNFTFSGRRVWTTDIFRPGATVDRVFTHTAIDCWGVARLTNQLPEKPRPVRHADGRVFDVAMIQGQPQVDWTGLHRTNEPRGFEPIEFTLPKDGYVSLNLFDRDGTVVRQLLTSSFYKKGSHRVMWDGLTTPSAGTPGEPVPTGDYTWRAIHHTGIGVRYEGRALDGEGSSWDAWGGDHGNPVAAAADGERVYLGWASGEAGKPLQAVDPATGKPIWKNIRGGIAGARLIASDGRHVYAYNDVGRYAAIAIYKLNAADGSYAEWEGTGSTDLPVIRLSNDDAKPTGLAVAHGRLFVSFKRAGQVIVLDSATGEKLKSLAVTTPGDLEALDARTLAVVSDRNKVVRLDVDTGEVSPMINASLPDHAWLSALAVDRDHVYAGVRGEAADRVLVFDRTTGELRHTIGRAGGRVPVGPWQADGLSNIAGMAIDATGQLWVAEDDGTPRRVSVWDAGTGKLLREFFGPSSYGAMGGVINPVDPKLMVAQGCEWKIDSPTGRATLVGVVHRRGIANARFGFSSDKRLFLATTNDALKGMNPVHLYERLGDADYRLRTTIWREKDAIHVWSDANDDQHRQDDEIQRYVLPGYDGWITGWYMPMTPDLTFYGSNYVFAVTGYTACGSPIYDLSQAKQLPMPDDVKRRTNMYARRGHGSADGSLMLYNGQYGAERSTFDCYDVDTGKLRWTYPNNYVGVHGSHKAPGPQAGMIRGAFDIVGSAKLPEPIGNLFIIPTNKGEWHLLTGEGFYLARLFEGDPLGIRWPEKPEAGAVLDQTPPGAGEEAFGGSITHALDGTLYLTVGHTSYWKTRVTGLDTVQELAGGALTITHEDQKLAEAMRADQSQSKQGRQRWTLRRQTPTFTGSFKDISAEPLSFSRQPNAAVRVAGAWDDANLYLAWEVKDDTPWVNAADAPEFVYARGDSVDLQLDLDGGIRVAIAPHNGGPVVVAYSKKGTGRDVRFRSGVVDDYGMRVRLLEGATVKIHPDPTGKSYVVQAAIPLEAIGLKPTPGLVLRGDVGALHSNADGNDTALRSYWNNLNTGIVSDEVFELKLDPSHWGELVFSE